MFGNSLLIYRVYTVSVKDYTDRRATFMHKALRFAWFYILCAAFAVACTVALVPSLSNRFAITAFLTSGALYIASAVISLLIIAFIVKLALKRLKKNN